MAKKNAPSRKKSPSSKATAKGKKADAAPAPPPRTARASSLIDTRVVYCGDNLQQLARLPDECVDLIYIDPPFNSNRNYEVFWGESKEKRSFEDRHESTNAYISFMKPRCIEMHRVLKKTGSFYFHCDWHASHYVKVMLDLIFGENQFQNEIIWKRASAHNDPRKYGNIHDTLFFYTRGREYTWNPQYTPYSDDYLASEWRQLPSGRFYKAENMLDPRGSMEEFEFKGTRARWRTNHDGMMALWNAPQTEVPASHGRIKLGKDGNPIKRCRIIFLDEMPGVALQSIWDDIDSLRGGAKERLGYPTQKPLALLERIINASSNPNDIVLDAFCGCGTALVAAQNLGRQWIGIDVSPTACRVMAKRLKDVCKLPESESLWRNGRGFVVRDLPKTEEELRKYPPFEFENWAVTALGGLGNAAKVGDKGIDGRIFLSDRLPAERGEKTGELDFMGKVYVIQVKQSDKVGRPVIDQFEAVMMREDVEKGFVVGFGFTSDAERECAAFYKRTGKKIELLTVAEILDLEKEELAYKLA